MKKILLHICCGPCAITTVEHLQNEGFEVSGLFYNPNIHGASEYLRRKEGALEVAARLNFPLYVAPEPEYAPQEFFRAVTFKETNRCLFCYKLRLQKLFDLARSGELGSYSHVSSSLLYSRYQRHQAILAIGQRLAMGQINQNCPESEPANLQVGCGSIAGEVGLSPEQALPGPQFYYADFRAGWSRGITLSKKWGIYRQKYCGCLYSETERCCAEA